MRLPFDVFCTEIWVSRLRHMRRETILAKMKTKNPIATIWNCRFHVSVERSVHIFHTAVIVNAAIWFTRKDDGSADRKIPKESRFEVVLISRPHIHDRSCSAVKRYIVHQLMTSHLMPSDHGPTEIENSPPCFGRFLQESSKIPQIKCAFRQNFRIRLLNVFRMSESCFGLCICPLTLPLPRVSNFKFPLHPIPEI